MNITDLFCTPEQGRRLKELVMELEYSFEWESFRIEGMSYPQYLIKERKRQTAIIDLSIIRYPALTLQELRDVAKKANLAMIENAKTFLLDSFDYHELENLLDVGTAPELAAWVIERLEEGR